MSTWNIYHKDGSKLTDVNGEQITVHGLEYSDSWMGECFLTINFKHEVPINFQIGDYIVYRGERFELNYEPGKDKQARPDTYGEGFVYDSVKFNALQDELARAEFLDVVLNDNELHYTSLPKFPFFVQTLDDLLDRIQANLDEQIGAGLWKIYSRNKERSVQRGALESEWLSVYGEKTEDNVIESMSITVDSKKCWDALALVNEKWDVNFIVRGRNIYVGTTGIEAGHIFSYGLGKGLYEIVQNADSDQSVITRLRAYGSEKNLPSHYYADLGVKYVANITKVVTASTNVELELDLDYIETYFKNKRTYVISGQTQEQSNGWVLQVTFDFQTTITGYVTQYGSSDKCRFYSELKGGQVDSGDEESKEKLDAFIAQVNVGNTKMYITSGLNKKDVPSSMKEYAKNLPNNMSINRLMLPGFPHVSLSDFYDSLTEQEKKYVNPTGKQHKFSTDPYRPYIDSVNIEQIGLRSASQFFDTDDKTNGVIEIYPTIEEMEIGGVRVDEIDEGVAPDDDGRFGDNETVKNVDIYLNKAIDFDINDLKDDDFSISMKDGMCGGRTFKVASSTKVDGRWRLTIERSKDDALELWFPYKDYPIKSGDHFVLTGITLPDSYVKAASLKLLKYAIALIDKNDYTRYVYQPKVDELFMARQHDKAQADETGTIKSLHDTLKAGDLMNFNDTDLNIEGIISIDQLTIKEEDGKIPTYDITLREDKEVGTIQKIQQQISSLQSGNGGTGAGLTTTQVKNQVATEGSKHFISKINDDTAHGTITWEKIQKLLSGLLVGNFNNENGGSWTPDAEGRSHLITDYLEVRMKAIFEELVIKKTSTIGGKEIISPAGGVVAHKVETVTVTYNEVSQKAYRCYFLAEQEGDAVDNDFAIGDQVRSESFNVRKGTYHKVGNHFYWRLVIGRDEEPVELEGKKYHYIDLSDTDCATASDVPAKGDVLSQCGNRTDIERQNCLIFSAVDTYSPSIGLYHGINSYSFANREYVEYGVNKQTNKAFFNVYGDMYVGDRPTKENNYEGSSYIKYDSAAKQVSVKGKISAKSTVDGKELSQYIKENSAKGLTEEQVNNLIKNSQVITDLQNQVDGAIETWFYEGVPTLKNAPASSWTTDKDKDTHLGDLYYDNKTGKAYRFAKDGNTYKWTVITDTDIAKALSDASKAQETADGKMKVFSTQPTPPYQVGDIWVNATYPSDGSTYKNEVLRCQTDKKAGSQFAIADWVKASKYTDDTVANAAKKAAEDAQKAAQTAQTNVANLGKTVTTNKKSFDNYVKDGYLEPSEIAAMAQDSKRLEDDFAAAEKSYNEVKGAEVLKSTKELTALNAAFATLTTAKKELVNYLSDISSRYNAANTEGKATIVSAVGTKFNNFQSAYSAFYDKLGLANAYITSKIYGDLGVVIGDVTSLAYLKKALMDAPDTEINGGLVLTSLIGLRDTDGNTTAGINGITEKSAKGGGIAAWFGGEMVDKDYNDGSKTPANTIFRFDGSGYVAGGAIWWGTDGRVHADPTSFIISEKNLGAYLTFFEPTWKAGSAGTSVADLVSLKPNAPFTKLGVSGDAAFEGAISFHGIKLTYDATNKAIKIDGNLYATGGITAYGAASSGAGGGGLNASVISYARILEGSYTDADLTSIPNAYAIKALSSRIDNIATELGGLNLSWNNITGKPSTFAPSAHKHKWVDITDRITKVSQLTNDAGYLTAHQSLASYYTKAEIDAKGYTANKGTVTSVALTLPTGLTCATKTITTSGTFAISLASGYSIPTTAKQTAWDGAVSAKHTHSNKSVLDGISSTKVSHWDSAYGWYSLMTTDEETADGIINKWNEVVSFLANIAQTDTLSGIVDGINKSISDEVTRAKKAEGVNASGISTNKTSITTLQGYFTSGSAKKALQLTNARKLWGNSFNGTADINGSIIVPSGKYISIGNIKLEYDATNKALKITNTTTDEVANLYTSGGVSAYGVGTSPSSGGGLNGSVKAYADAVKLTTENLSEIASAYSVAKLYSEIQNVASAVPSISVSVPTGGNALTGATYNASTGVITFTKGTFLTAHQSLASYYTKAEIDAKGYTTNKGTVTSVGLTLPTGLVCATKTITTSGTFAISLASGYSIPTTTKQTAWDGAVSAKHTHSNKSVLDGISSTKVSHWDSAYGWYSLMTTDEETADGIINKWNEVVSFLANIAQTDTLSGIVDGINKSISDEVTRAKKAEGVNASGISTNKTSITTLQGYFTSGSAKKALQLTNARKLWGNSFNGTADINGSIIVPSGKYISIGNIKMEYDATNKALKITNTTTNEVANLYTSGGVSAYGVGTSSSSGGGLNGSVKAYADAIRLTTENLSEIASAYSVAKLYSEIQNVASAVPSISVSVPTGGNALTGATYDASTGVITFTKGTFLTAHQSLVGYVNAIAVSGSGNAVTAVTKSGKTITFTKGATFLTSHQSLAAYLKSADAASTYAVVGHTHKVKINGAEKTINPSTGTIVDLGTYLTSHQSLAAYMKTADANNTFSKIGHTHGYASSVKLGETSYAASNNVISLPAYPTALKSPTAITIQANGTSLGSYDGSTAKTFNLTYANVGAASAGHNHDSVYSKLRHTHPYLPLTGGTLTGGLTVNSNVTSSGIGTFKVLRVGSVDIKVDDSGNLYIINKDGKAAANFYATGGISAYGASDGTSSGGGLNGSVKSYADALKLASESLSEIASAYSIKALDSRIVSLEGGSAMDVSVSGSGNAVTAISKSGTTISVTKGITFLTSHQSLASYLTRTDAASLYQPKGSYLTAHQSLDGYVNEVATSGTGNAITSVSKSGKKLTFTKGATFLTSHQSLSAYLKSADAANTYLKLSGGAMTGNISYKGSKNTYDMIRFVDNNVDIYGNGICIGGGGLTIIGGGESASEVLKQHTNGGDENMIVANDAAIDFFSNMNSGWDSRKAGSFDTSGYWNGVGFKKNNSNDNYVLTGGGGHKAISTLSVSYASSAGSANSVAWSNVSGRPTKVSQFTNDSGYITSTSSITGNAGSATRLQNSRKLWNNSFNGTGDIGGTILPSATHTYNLGSTTYMFERTYTRYIETDSGYDLRLICSGNELIRLGSSDNVVYFNSQGLSIKNDVSSGCSMSISEIRDSELNYGQINVVDTNGSRPKGRHLVLQYEQGNVGIGVKYPSEKLEVNGNILVNTSNTSGDKGLKINANSKSLLFGVGTSTKIGVYSYSDSKWLFYTDTSTFYTSGGILATGGVTAYSSSDIRLKQDLRKLDYLGIIKAMGGTFGFAWKKDNTRSIGWIAQHVLCNPHLKDIVETDDNGYYKINYWSPKLIATAFGAIEQVGDEVSRLKARVVFLESEVQRLSGDKEDCNKKRLDNKNINLLN